MADNIQTLTFDEAVRKRPGMFLGDNGMSGILNLICGLITDSIYACSTDNIFFLFEIRNEGKMSLKMNFQSEMSSIITQQFSDEERDKDIYHLRTLKAVTKELEVIIKEKELLLNFSLDTAVFIDRAIDYQILTEELSMLAILNRKAEILIKDSSQKHLSQNYFHFPNGIFYLYERIKKNILVAPEFQFFHEGKMKENTYQIALVCRKDWCPTPTVLSFANDTNTPYGGSLVEGILDGLAAASRKYISEKQLSTLKIKRKKLFNGLIIVASVRGKVLVFEGSTKQKLATKEVRAQAKKIIFDLAIDYLNNNKEAAETFLARFDDSNPMSKMF